MRSKEAQVSSDSVPSPFVDVIVFGAGAMGSFFGGMLSRRNRVTLVCRAEHANAIRKSGLRIAGKTAMIARPTATTSASRIRRADLVIISTKAYDTERACRALRRIATRAIWLTLQNGLENADVLARYATKVIAGTTTHGVTFVRPGEVRHAGIGDTIIGALAGAGEDDVIRLRDVLEESGIRTRISPNIRRELWLKVIANAGINPLAALTGLRNGQLLAVPGLRAALEGLCSEAASVARAEGFEIADREAIDLTVRIARRTRENRASMLQDVQLRRRTEVDAITGAVLRAAKRHDLRVPMNLVSHALVMGLERSYRGPSG